MFMFEFVKLCLFWLFEWICGILYLVILCLCYKIMNMIYVLILYLEGENFFLLYELCNKNYEIGKRKCYV